MATKIPVYERHIYIGTASVASFLTLDPYDEYGAEMTPVGYLVSDEEDSNGN